MTIDKFEATTKRNKKIAKEAKERRAKLLNLLPEEFTTKLAIETWKMHSGQVSAIIQKMVNKSEIHLALPPNRKPMTYRKVQND